MKCAPAVISEKIMITRLELLKVIADVDVRNLGKEIKFNQIWSIINNAVRILGFLPNKEHLRILANIKRRDR
jgi:hypothetical protein